MDEKLKQKLRNLKAVVFDADGVFFTGRAFIDPERGEVLKERSHIDGQGISLLRACGIKIGFISGEKKFLKPIEEKLNSLPSVLNGAWAPVTIFEGYQGMGKVEMIEKWLRENNLSWEECAAMGDDIADYEILKKAGVAAAPAQAEKEIKEISLFVAERKGGDGAIRDLCNLILEAKEINLMALNLR